MKAGVRFNPNLVDTVCRHGLSYSFYLVVILLCALCGARAAGADFTLNTQYFSLSVILCLVYLIFYVCRLQYYLHLRRRLRRDDAPLTVEAYAIVLMDVSRYTGRVGRPRRSTVLFKETGSEKPRFFTAEIRYGIRQHYYKDQIGRVYMDRKNNALYTLDADSAFQTVSERRSAAKFRIYELNRTAGSVIEDQREPLKREL